MLDIIIIGAGVVGSMIARNLSKYKLNILVLEKENDVGNGSSSANSAIVHSGYDPEPGSLKARLNVRGNELFENVAKELDVEFERNGSITLANTEEEVQILDSLALRAKQNGVEVKILNHDELKEIEPNITDQVIKGLLAPTCGIINPFELVVAAMENAMDNGVNLHLCEKVESISKFNNGYVVNTNKDSYETKYIINCAGVYSDQVNEMVNEKSFTIKPRRGEYFVLDHFDKTYVKHTLFNVPSSKGKGVLVSPTTNYNYLVGPSSEYVLEKDDVSTDKETLDNVKKNAYSLVDNLRLDKQIRIFSGIRAVSDTGDFVIEETAPGFINCGGIQSPGLASSPAIAEMVEGMIKDKELKEDYNPYRRPLPRLNKKSLKERQEYFEKDPAFGNIICRCEKISEGEIVDVIHRNCGATSIKGVKKRVRPGFGKCQGGFCESLVLKILARELNVKNETIVYGKENAYILKERTKGE